MTRLDAPRMPMCRSQHIFVNPRAPGSAYGMTYNCIACGDNAMTCNDGYHIQHHLNSKTHWSELPVRFMESLEEHAAQAGDGFSEFVDVCEIAQVASLCHCRS